MTEYDPFAGVPSGARIMVAYSGGVDSSYAAELCRDRGFEVELATLSLLPDGAMAERASARAAEAGFVHHVVDMRAPFREKVMHRVWQEYSCGRTPNPCALCNPLFKFGALREFALSRGCTAMVTGHYAKIRHLPGGRTVLERADCRSKDQSYFLFSVSEESLAFCCTPLGGWEKSEVSAQARQRGLAASQDRESQDVCFAGDSLPETLCTLFPEPPVPGFFTDENGKRLAPHRGIQFYTIGQRKGTHVPMGVPAFVKSIDRSSGNITLTTDPEQLMRKTLYLEECRWLADLPGEFAAQVQIRYRSRPAEAAVRKLPLNRAEIVFAEPVRAAASGQAGVCYSGDRLLGGGWILTEDPE